MHPYYIENLLFENSSDEAKDEEGVQGTSRDKDEKIRAFVQDIYARSKPSANYEVQTDMTYQPPYIEFGVTADGSTSELDAEATHRQLGLLSSQDPLAVSCVRTIHGLALSDLFLSERCFLEYSRLHSNDQNMIFLIQDQTLIDRYGKQDNAVKYGPIMWL
jgi:hypothetical protein